MMKRSYRLYRTLSYVTFPLTVAGMISCGGGTSSGPRDLATVGDAAPCYIDDMLIPTQSLPACENTSGPNNGQCPQHACTPADCPPGCAYPLA
jgi:hypothetical protein